MIPLVPFRRARLVGGACPIGERGQDAADGCPKVLERVLVVPPTSRASSAAGARAQAPRRLASWGRAAPRGPAATRCPLVLTELREKVTQTNGDRATREQRGSTSHTLAAPGGSPQ